MSDEIRYLAEISKQNVEGGDWILLTAYSKKWEEWDKLIGKKEPSFEDLEDS